VCRKHFFGSPFLLPAGRQVWFVFFCLSAGSRSGKGRAKQKKMNESTDERIRHDEIIRDLKAMISERLAYRRSNKPRFCCLISKKPLLISLLPDNSGFNIAVNQHGSIKSNA
jgi:hypothetical protein